jgi:hypothetical protein
MSIQKKMSLTSLGLLAVGLIGYFILSRDLWVFYFFAHLGALGVMGLSGSGAGALAQRKSRSFWRAFALGAILPIIAGIVAVLIFLWGVNGRLYCGGSVSLATAVLVALLYLLVSKRTIRPVA